VRADYERQLKFRTPPDTTVVTWCSWHEGAGPSGKAPTLFLDGHVDSLAAGDVENFKWRTMPKKE
jgi:prepilin-type processing-associated H-X9-DG protein